MVVFGWERKRRVWNWALGWTMGLKWKMGLLGSGWMIGFVDFFWVSVWGGLELGLFGLRWESWDGWDLLILRERVILMVVVVGGDWVGSGWVYRVLLFFFCSSLQHLFIVKVRTSLGQMAAAKATLPVHFRHGMQWQTVS
jgi:hypothetical protein